MSKAERSRNMRWKRPALAELGYNAITTKLDDIINACGDIHWTSDDDEMLLNALDGDEEEAFEFKMLFTALENEAYQLSEMLRDVFCFYDDPEQRFDDCTVALIGDRFQLVGYDDYEEDYFHLTSYDEELAFSKSGERIMRLTKKEMLSTIGQCLGIILSFHNVEMKYEYLKATFDILRDGNTSILKTIKEIEEAYETANSANFWGKEAKNFEKIVGDLPDRFWIE